MPTFTTNFIYGNKTPNDKFRYLLNASYYGRYYAAQGYKLVYGNNFNHAINRYELKDYDGMRNTAGANLALEFRPNSELKITARGLFSSMFDDKYQRKMMYMYASGENQGIWQQNLHGLLIRTVGGGQLEAQWRPAPRLEITDKAASYTNSFSYGPVPYGRRDPRNGYFVMEFKQIRTDTRYQDQLLITQDGKAWDPNGETPLWGYAKLLDIDHPIPGQGDRYNALTPLLNFPATPDSMYFSKAFSELGQNRESDPIVGQLDLKYAVTNNFKLKFGGKFRVKEGVHEHSLHTWIINPTVTKGKVFFMSQFDLEPLNERGGYLRELGPQYKASFIPFLTRKAFDNSGQFLTSLGDSIREYTMTPVNQEYRFWAGSRYQYTELQSAGYAMFEWTVRSKLNITAGVRVEHTQLEQSSDTLNSTPENLVYDPVTNNFYYKPETRYTRLNYLALLPGVNLTYSPNSQINLRAAVTRTFHRPNFAESKPGYAVISYSDFEFTFGNPAIRPAYSWNFDASLEYYFGAAGIFTIGGFYKHVTDHIFLVTTGDIDPFSGIIYKSYANAGTSFVAGAEISLTRKLTFLPGFLSGFGLSGNFTYSFSRMSVPGRKASQPLAGQTPFLYNVSLFYEKYRIQARVALNYTGPFLKGLNLAAVKDIGLLHTDTGFDLFQGENYTLDAHVSYGITPRLNIFLEGNNLLNWRYFEYRGRPERPTRIEYYRQRFQLGIKFNF